MQGRLHPGGLHVGVPPTVGGGGGLHPGEGWADPPGGTHLTKMLSCFRIILRNSLLHKVQDAMFFKKGL